MFQVRDILSSSYSIPPPAPCSTLFITCLFFFSFRSLSRHSCFPVLVTHFSPWTTSCQSRKCQAEVYLLCSIYFQRKIRAMKCFGEYCAWSGLCSSCSINMDCTSCIRASVVAGKSPHAAVVSRLYHQINTYTLPKKHP